MSWFERSMDWLMDFVFMPICFLIAVIGASILVYLGGMFIHYAATEIGSKNEHVCGS